MRRIVLAGICGLLVSACGGSAPTPTPTVLPPTLPPLPTATFGPSPTTSSSILIPVLTPTTGLVGAPAVSGDRLVVINTEGDGANLRTDPARSAQSIVIIPEGDIVDIVGADRTADGITWRNVRDRLGNTGWMSSGFLGPPGSASTIPTRPSVTRAAQTTVPAKPAGTATRPTATRAPSTATRAADAPPTAAPKVQPPAAPSGLAVQANVSRPTISTGSQGLHVRVTNGGQPVSGARVVAVVQDQGQNRTLDLGSTDSSGVATRSFDVGTPRGTVTINITVTTPDGRSVSASTSYSAG
ncbi:MAG: SH3 domain-containing protein [Chloroflexota bacterium]